MSVPYRITVRISEKTMEKLEEMVESFQYESISDIIRRAIDEFVERHHSSGPVSRVDVLIPRKILEDLERDVSQGTAISIEDLIRLILRDYTASRINRELGQLSDQKNLK
ncbi:hypothetical protein GCM10007108_09290 [Thermogymnomonas acidicola]|uniref:Ribbon-helix-helix protein CopG domain-containing protein n=1 Tax=Thermogymnomonas acidicola TaxID=399579 RepID=A0AA37F9D5_9ARCH|nr:ribbon-helix-helix domain-containing protein [Thermogymnomonas acidicola]GGM73411.1 hypothetical protein GCM10007108_09290 [Thermogymnomonas acidicola]